VKVIGIDGSGRGEGNTATLVRAVLEGAAEAGAETDLLWLGGMELAGCNACQQCKETHQCVIQDDMQRFYDVAPEADVLVLGSPMYLDHVTAQTKAFIDRLYCYLGSALENHYPNKDARLVAAITYGAGGEHTYDGVLEWIKGRFGFYFKLETVATFAIPACLKTSVLDRNHPVVRQAYETGKCLP